MTKYWKSWLAPGVVGAIVIAVISWQLEGIRDRFTSVEARIGATESRADASEPRLSSIDEKIDRRGEAIELRVTEPTFPI